MDAVDVDVLFYSSNPFEIEDYVVQRLQNKAADITMPSCHLSRQKMCLFLTSPALLNQWKQSLTKVLKEKQSLLNNISISFATKSYGLGDRIYRQTKWDLLIIDGYSRATEIIHTIPYFQSCCLTTIPISTLKKRRCNLQSYAYGQSYMNSSFNEKSTSQETEAMSLTRPLMYSQHIFDRNLSKTNKDARRAKLQMETSSSLFQYQASHPNMNRNAVERLQDTDQCEICWEDINIEKDSFVITSCCFHKFCPHCISSLWRNHDNNHSCPICRHTLSLKDFAIIRSPLANKEDITNPNTNHCNNITFTTMMRNLIEISSGPTVFCTSDKTHFDLLKTDLKIKRLTGNSEQIAQTIQEHKNGKIDALYISTQYPCPDLLHLPYVHQIIRIQDDCNSWQNVLKCCHHSRLPSDLKQPLSVMTVVEQGQEEML